MFVASIYICVCVCVLIDTCLPLQPPIEEAEAARDAAVATLLAGLGDKALNTASLVSDTPATYCVSLVPQGLTIPCFWSFVKTLLHCFSHLVGIEHSSAYHIRHPPCPPRPASAIPPAHLQPPAAHGSDVREMVQRAIEEAKRIPPPPPLPTNYSGLVDDIARWIEALQASQAELATAQQVGTYSG